MDDLYEIDISVGYAFFLWYTGNEDKQFKQALYEALFKEDTKEIKIFESGKLVKLVKVEQEGTDHARTE